MKKQEKEELEILESKFKIKDEMITAFFFTLII